MVDKPPVAASPILPRSSRALRGLFLLVLIFAVREARPLLAPVLIAVMLTFALAPAVRWLHARGVPAMLGALLLVLALLLSTVSLVMSLARPAASWWEAAPTTVSQLLEEVEKLRASIPGLRPPQAAPRSSRAVVATPPPDPLRERLASEGVALTGMVLTRSLSLLLAAAATVILTYFLLASEHWLLSRVVEAVPSRRTRALVLGGVRAAQREIGRYLASVGIINAAVGLITALALWLLDLPNPALWGVLTALLCFVPYLGPMTLMAMLLLAGISSFGTGLQVFGPTLAFMLIHAVESNFVSPMVVGRRLSLSALSVFLSVLFWGWLWGIAGALIAVPLLIGLRSLCRRTRGLRLLRLFLEGDRREAPPSLRSLLRRPVPQPARSRYT
ncbi:MAG: AI-2E family transporter [Burkholderiales bacterium]|jgi:predicted PurR-regulated permease PerM|nr:AI-2E family transporter [Burkholderiales bacterium]